MLCEYCGKIYSNKCSFSRHRKQHTSKIIFLCADCGNQYKRKDYLQEHLRSNHLTATRLETEAPPDETSPEKSHWDGTLDFIDDFLDEIKQNNFVNTIDNLPRNPTKASWRANTPPPEEAGNKRRYHCGAVLDATAFTLSHWKKYSSPMPRKFIKVKDD